MQEFFNTEEFSIHLMAAVLLGWDDKAQQAVEFWLHNQTTLTGLPKTPLNSTKSEWGWWLPLQEDAFGSIVEVDLSGAGGLVDIQDGSFAWLPNLRVVRLNPKTGSIGSWAFRDCKSLTSINIPSGVTSIGESAFSYCTSLMSINIPAGITSIEAFAFSSCTGLTRINIPIGVTSIGWHAFSSCTSVKSINISGGATSIEADAFSDCTSLAGFGNPDGVKSIDSKAFSSCSLKVVLLDDPRSMILKGLPAARRFAAVGLVDRALAAAQGADVLSAVVVSVGGRKLCTPIEDDWRFLGR